MLQIMLWNGYEYSIVDKDYNPNADTLKSLITKAREYIKSGYMGACVYLIDKDYIGDVSKDKEIVLFCCKSNKEIFRELNSNRIISLSACLSDVDLLQTPLEVMIRCEGLLKVYKQCGYKRCPSCGQYHQGNRDNCLVCKKLKPLGFKISKNKDIVDNYFYC